MTLTTAATAGAAGIVVDGTPDGYWAWAAARVTLSGPSPATAARTPVPTHPGPDHTPPRHAGPTHAGPSHAGPGHAGSGHAGSSHPGLIQSDPAHSGLPHSAPTHPASAHSAPAHSGPAHLASAYPGPAHSGPAYPASDHSAPAHSSSAYPASDHSGPAHFAPAHPGPAYPASASAASAYPAPVHPGPTHSIPIHTGSTNNIVEGYVGKLVQAASVGELHVHQHAAGEQRDDRPWLRSVWQAADAAGAVVELRYLTVPGSTRVDTYLLVRTGDRDPDGAVAAAARLRHAVSAALPAPLVAHPAASADEVLRVLAPCWPDAHGLAEVRKAVTTARAVRAGAPWLAVVTPWRGGGSWAPVVAALGELGFPAAVSVGVMAYRIGPGLRALLADRAAGMTALAEPAASLTSVYGGPQPPDQFALAARPVVAEAVGRYVDAAFQIRVSLVAARPLPARLAEAVAAAISPGLPGRGIAGAAAVVVRPTGAEADTAWRNVTGLNFEPLPVAHLQGNEPGSVGDVELTLGSIADVDEAAAAFRLPVGFPGAAS